MSEPIDAMPYATQFQGDVPTTLALAQALLAGVPAQANTAVQRASAALATQRGVLLRGWDLTHHLPQNVARVDADHRMDNAWAMIFQRLEAYTWLPVIDHPRVPEAVALLHRLFPNGKDFLSLPYLAEWSETDQRIRWLDGEKLRTDLETFVGEFFVRELDQAFKNYGLALGVTATTEAPVQVDLAASLRQVKAAIVQYSLAVVVLGNEDEAHLAAAKTALLPLDEARTLHAAQHRKSIEAPEPVAPTTPAAKPEGTPQT
jgi:hypothetical protein